MKHTKWFTYGLKILIWHSKQWKWSAAHCPHITHTHFIYNAYIAAHKNCIRNVYVCVLTHGAHAILNLAHFIFLPYKNWITCAVLYISLWYGLGLVDPFLNAHLLGTNHVLHSAQVLGTLRVSVVLRQVCRREAILVSDGQVHTVHHQDLAALREGGGEGHRMFLSNCQHIKNPSVDIELKWTAFGPTQKEC